MTAAPAKIVAVTGVLLLAVLFRLYHINQQSIWFDEAFAWNIVMQPDMYPRIAADTHPPLYYLMLRGWVAVMGDSALALRYLSALTSLFTVVFVYRVGMEMGRGRVIPSGAAYGGAHNHAPLQALPLLAALIIALSDAEISLAQEARNYALYSCLAALSMWLYLRWLRRMGHTSITAALWVISTAALLYTHYQGTFIPAIQALHALVFLHGRKRLEAVGLLAVTGLLFAPWFVGVTIPQAQNAIDRALPFAIPSNWETLAYLRDGFLGAMWALMLVLAVYGVWGLLAGTQGIRAHSHSRVPLSPLAQGGNALPINYRVRWHHTGIVFLIVAWVVVPFGVLFFGNFFADLLTERKLLLVVPAVALLVGAGLAHLSDPARTLLAAALLVYGFAAVDFYRDKEPWNVIAAEIVPYVQATDLVMVEAGVGQYPVKYYWQRLLPEGVYLSTFPFLGDETMAPTTDRPTYFNGLLPIVLETTVEKRLGDVATAWLVYWSQDSSVLERLDEAGYQRTMTTGYELSSGNAVEVYRYDVLPGAPIGSYENGMTLQAAEVDLAAGRVDLWWSADTTLAADYTTSVLVLDGGGAVIAQKDSPPPRMTGTWSPGDVVYDPKFLELAGDLPQDYSVVVQVYQWRPEGILNFNTTVGERWLALPENK